MKTQVQALQNTDEQLEKGLVYERVRLGYARLRARSTGGWVLTEGPVQVWACPFIDLFNGLMSPAWPEGSTEELWRQAVALYRQTGHGMFVSIGPATRASGLRERIQREGFRSCESLPFMHLDLAELREPARPEGVRVERIHDFSFFERHTHPWLGPVGAPYRKMKLQFLREHGEGRPPRLWQFLAFSQRRIVGAATLFSRGHEVAIFDLVVVKSQRRRGIGSRLTFEACHFARELGMRAAGLSSSNEGLGMYRKVGFSSAGRYSDFFLPSEKLAGIGV